MRSKCLYFTLFALISLHCVADEFDCELEKPPILSLGAGIFDVTRKHPMALYQIEYRFGYQLLTNLRPQVGIMWTQKGSVYLYGGIAYDIYLGKFAVITPSFAPGIYFKGGGKNLHYPLEFRSSIEAAYLFNNEGRLGVQFYHLSHAGLGRKNPGSECLAFFYSIPLNR